MVGTLQNSPALSEIGLVQKDQFSETQDNMLFIRLFHAFVTHVHVKQYITSTSNSLLD